VQTLRGIRIGENACGRIVGIPIHFHTHDTSGINAGTSVLKAAEEAGVDVADGAIAAHERLAPASRISIPSSKRSATRRATRSSMSTPSTSAPTIGKPFALTIFRSTPVPRPARRCLYQHEIPGGQYTNLREQAAAMGLGHRWREAEKNVRGGKPAFRRHRQSHTLQQSRWRHDALPHG